MINEKEVHSIEYGPWNCPACDNELLSWGIMKAHFEQKHPEQKETLRLLEETFGGLKD